MKRILYIGTIWLCGKLAFCAIPPETYQLASQAALAAYMDKDRPPAGKTRQAYDKLIQQGWHVELFSHEIALARTATPSAKSSGTPALPASVKAFELQKGQNQLQRSLPYTRQALDSSNYDSNMFPVARTQVLLACKDQHLIIAFRGSDNWQNWVLNNTLVQPIPFYNTDTAVHQGFYLYLLAALKDPRLSNWFASHLGQYRDILFTGHSLGGAATLLQAAKLVSIDHNSPRNIFIITFGQPAVGQYDFAERYSSKFPNYRRVSHPLDPIVYITEPFGYVHFGIPYHLPATGTTWQVHSMENYYKAFNA